MFGATAKEVYVMEDEHYDLNIQVRYSFLTGEDTGYVGIASYMRNRLIADGTLKVNPKSDAITFYYDIISGIRETSHVL